MKVFHRIRTTLVLMVSMTLLSTTTYATDDLDEFVFSKDPYNAPTAVPASIVIQDHDVQAATEQTQHKATQVAAKEKSPRKSKKRAAPVNPPAPVVVESQVASETEPATQKLMQDKTTPGSAQIAAPVARTETAQESSSDSILSLISKHTKLSPSSTTSSAYSGGDSDNNPPSSPVETTTEVSSTVATEDTKSMWKIVQEVAVGALGLLGVRYRFGGNTPAKGLDCSGFVRYVFQQALGIKLPRSSHEISQVGAQVEWDNLIPGDLVFFNTRNVAFSHVGIYLGDNRFIHAPRTGKDVEIVRITDRYWSTRFNGGRRILGQLAMRAPQHN